MAAALVTPVCGGCVDGSLATSTGDRTDGQWSIAPRQKVHVGETVQFSFVLTKALRDERIDSLGVADYCVFEIGGERFDVEPDEYGRFLLTHTFDKLEPGQSVTIRVTAFRQRGRRDHMRVAGSWVVSDSTSNSADEKAAKAFVHLTAYQSHLRMALPKVGDDYDFSTARLILRRADGRQSAVFTDRPPRHGFTLVPRAGGDGWWIEYLPRGDEVNPYGQTEAEFSIYDQAGNRHEFKGTVRTP